MCDNLSCEIGRYQNNTEFPLYNSFIVWACGCIEILQNPKLEKYEKFVMAHNIRINEKIKKIVLSTCHKNAIYIEYVYESLQKLGNLSCPKCGISLNYLMNG